MESSIAVTFDDKRSPVIFFPSVLSEEHAKGMMAVAERRGSLGGKEGGSEGYQLYVDPRTSNSGGEMDEFFASWPQSLKGRLDIMATTMKQGGRFQRLGQKKGGQFRDTFLYAESGPCDEGIYELINHAGFIAAAKNVHGGQRCLIEPQIMFANFMLPGENQAIHTDVPEFRGCSRVNAPEWLLVCMHHSQLFTKWYIPIVTAISYFSSHSAGELVVYLDPSQPGVPHSSCFNTALLLDTDSIYHGVDPTGGVEMPAPVVPRGATLLHKGKGRWCVRTADGTVMPEYADLGWQDIRMSVQWKAHCFVDEVERQAFKNCTDAITPTEAYSMIKDELVRRGKVSGTEEPLLMAVAMCEEFIRVPTELQSTHNHSATVGACKL